MCSLELFCKEAASILVHFFTYLIICINVNSRIFINFLWANLILSLFLLLKLFQLWLLGPPSFWFFVLLDITPTLVLVFEHFLTFWHHKTLHVHLVFSLTHFWNHPLLGGTLVPFVGEWYLGTKLWAAAFSLVLGWHDFWAVSVNICKCAHAHICMCVYTLFTSVSVSA